MRNPLMKRIPRELKKEFGKYLVIFLFMAATIGFVSGFLVADNSMTTAYDNSFKKYVIEDGHFILEEPLQRENKEALEKEEHISIYPLEYKEETVGKSTVRVYKNREKVNLACLMEGELPKTDTDICIDRLFANNNEYELGDTLTVQNIDYHISGLVSLPDYSALFRSNTDMMFDAQNFTIALMTDEGFQSLDERHINYAYAWKYDDNALSEKEKDERGTELMKALVQKGVALTDFVKEADNQAIHFTGDDMGSDKMMMICLLYIVIVIMAFVFAVTTSNTIEQEAAVIGTLRASGYTKGEVMRHYLSLPVIVTLIGAVIGNVLGYTIFKNIVAGMYYGSYSLPSYQTLWSPYAFVMTTIVPCILMLIVNVIILSRKLSLSPLKFLRHDLKHSKNRKAIHLNRGGFFHRFRLRVILQNFSGYIILLIGIYFANIILLFGLMMTPLLHHYKQQVLDNMICSYQYNLKSSFESANEQAEKYCVSKLETDFENRSFSDEILIYGIEERSSYLPKAAENRNGVTVSEGILEKYGLKVGDTISLKTKYGEDAYQFKITGSIVYPASLCVFMDIEEYRDTFERDSQYFNGYFCNEKLEDIDEKAIASIITQSDLTILADQLFDSMGNMMPMVSGFAILMYMLLVYLLSKVILEKNAAAISIVKILGYTNKEIAGLYLASTGLVTIVSVLISLPAAYFLIKQIYVFMISSFSGWLTMYIAPEIYIKMILFGLISYAAVGAFEYLKIRKIPMEEALKNTE